MIIQTETGSIYELEPTRFRRLGQATTFRLALHTPNAGEWATIEGHSEVQAGRSVLIYWRTTVSEDGRWRIESTVTSPVKEILSV